MGIIDDLKKAKIAHVATGKTDPTTIYLPLNLAEDVGKLGRNEVGQLSEGLLQNGPYYLEQTGLIGLKVKIIEAEAAVRFE